MVYIKALGTTENKYAKTEQTKKTNKQNKDATSKTKPKEQASPSQSTVAFSPLAHMTKEKLSLTSLHS